MKTTSNIDERIFWRNGTPKTLADLCCGECCCDDQEEIMQAYVTAQQLALLDRLEAKALEADWTEEVPETRIKTYRRVKEKAVPLTAIQQERANLSGKGE